MTPRDIGAARRAAIDRAVGRARRLADPQAGLGPGKIRLAPSGGSVAPLQQRYTDLGVGWTRHKEQRPVRDSGRSAGPRASCELHPESRARDRVIPADGRHPISPNLAKASLCTRRLYGPIVPISILQFDQTSLGLPTRDYFLRPSNSLYLEAYKSYLIKIATLLGAPLESATRHADELIDFETKLAEVIGRLSRGARSLIPLETPRSADHLVPRRAAQRLPALPEDEHRRAEDRRTPDRLAAISVHSPGSPGGRLGAGGRLRPPIHPGPREPPLEDAVEVDTSRTWPHPIDPMHDSRLNFQNDIQLPPLALRPPPSQQPRRPLPGGQAEILLHPLRQRAGPAAMEELRGSGEFEHGDGGGFDVRQEVLRREQQERCKNPAAG